ncbi:hypothetical protein HYFRA_00008279 [Hymenoscyphus fraxineus]|uniref:Uncharacterized protein n=1 Tax=Hymenoscyphus fraxineus TaxID=746836 RepID=A0A9N9PQ31_9HELO|nr:hypothetical protein HYFRA_00008279 [Hymenoscyphus fraxineus]
MKYLNLLILSFATLALATPTPEEEGEGVNGSPPNPNCDISKCGCAGGITNVASWTCINGVLQCVCK